jgi:Zn-dependent protease
MGGGTLRIGSIAGIPIEIHASWLLVYALITWSLAVGYFPGVIEDLPPLAYWVSGFVAALLLFVSVLAHELSHAFVARAHGVAVRGITLHVFGGVSHLEGESPSPRAEFLIAIVGPLTSFAVAAGVWAIRASGVLGPVPSAIATYLLFVNVAVGVFNLLPGFPLDGGRVLRAALWHWKGTLEQATTAAARVGTFVALGLMAVGILQIFGGNILGGFWLILIGLFLRGAAEASSAHVSLTASLGRLRVRDVMSAPVVTVPPDVTIARLAEDLWAHRFTSFPVVDDGRIHGIITLDDVRGVARERWDATRVADAMHAMSEELAVQSGEAAMAALQKAARNGVGRLAVVDDGRLVGYVSLKDITHAVTLKTPAPGRPVATAPFRRAA